MTSKTNENLVNCVIIFTVNAQFSSNFSWQVTEQLCPTNNEPGKRTTNYLYPFCSSVISWLEANMMIFVIVIFVSLGSVHPSCNVQKNSSNVAAVNYDNPIIFRKKSSNHKLKTSIFILHVNTTRKTIKLLVCLLLYLHKTYLARTFSMLILKNDCIAQLLCS